MHVVYETLSPPKNEVSFVFCSFLCVSLNVLVSFSHFSMKFQSIWEKAHQYIQTYAQKWAKYKENFMFKCGRVSYTTCFIFLYVCEGQDFQIPDYFLEKL